MAFLNEIIAWYAYRNAICVGTSVSLCNFFAKRKEVTEEEIYAFKSELSISPKTDPNTIVTRGF